MRFSKRDYGNAYSTKIVVRVYKNHSAVEGLVRQHPSCHERFYVVNWIVLKVSGCFASRRFARSELIISRFKTDFGQNQLCYPTLVCVSRSAFVRGVNNAGILYKISNGMSLISSADCSQLALLAWQGWREGRGGGQLPGFASRWQDYRTVFRTLDYITTTQKAIPQFYCSWRTSWKQKCTEQNLTKEVIFYKMTRVLSS